MPQNNSIFAASTTSQMAWFAFGCSLIFAVCICAAVQITFSIHVLLVCKHDVAAHQRWHICVFVADTNQATPSVFHAVFAFLCFQVENLHWLMEHPSSF